MEEYIDLSLVWEQYQMGNIQQKLDEMFPQYEFNIMEMLKKLLEGNVLDTLTQALKTFIHGLVVEAGGIRNILLYLILLGIISALLSHFTGVFESHQIADISFYMIYLLLMAVLLKCFYEAATITSSTVENIVFFTKIFMPTYFLAIGVAGGSVTAYAGYQILLFIIFLVEQVLLSVVLPFIYSYVLMGIMNGIWAEERLAVMVDFLGKGVRLALKAAIGCITGVSIFQSIITPVIDSLKSSAVQKAVSMVPGIGNVADGVVDMMIGSAVLIKNSIGVVLVVILLITCVIPLLKIALIAGCLKLGAAFMGIISDKRMSNSTNHVGEGGILLLKLAGTVIFLFVITIAIAAYTTNRGF